MRHLTFHPAFRAEVQSSLSRIHAKKTEHKLFKPLPSGGATERRLLRVTKRHEVIDHLSFDHIDNLLLVILQMTVML